MVRNNDEYDKLTMQVNFTVSCVMWHRNSVNNSENTDPTKATEVERRLPSDITSATSLLAFRRVFCRSFSDN